MVFNIYVSLQEGILQLEGPQHPDYQPSTLALLDLNLILGIFPVADGNKDESNCMGLFPIREYWVPFGNAEMPGTIWKLLK